MRTLKINWLEPCPTEGCFSNVAIVKTDSLDSNEDWLTEGDEITCEGCGCKGVIDVYDSTAYAIWEGNDDDI